MQDRSQYSLSDMTLWKARKQQLSSLSFKISISIISLIYSQFNSLKTAANLYCVGKRGWRTALDSEKRPTFWVSPRYLLVNWIQKVSEFLHSLNRLQAQFQRLWCCNSQNVKHKHKLKISGFCHGAGKLFWVFTQTSLVVTSRSLRTN